MVLQVGLVHALMKLWDTVLLTGHLPSLCFLSYPVTMATLSEGLSPSTLIVFPFMAWKS